MTVESATTATGTRPATGDELDPLSHTLAAAFRDDPVFGWLLPEERTRQDRLQRFFTLSLRHMGFARGAVFTCEQRAGAAVCMPPGRWQLPPRVALAQGPAFWRAFGRRLPIATAFQAKLELRHERRPHWYVLAVGVRPERQGQGLGSALLAPTLERCDREGLPAYLEASSERSAALYERLGFEHVGELRLAGSPPVWKMLRPPKQRGLRSRPWRGATACGSARAA
ncbi:MAG TPA: GNAT family N-acetyltransferase [Solirubrobacteraceae bacterium]|nr:GNAT family N-acetyltransferase [Solirubrobacteraceae bacterium]